MRALVHEAPSHCQDLLALLTQVRRTDERNATTFLQLLFPCPHWHPCLCVSVRGLSLRFVREFRFSKMSAIMPVKPLAADFKVLTSESGAGVIVATSRITHDHSHSTADIAGREKTRTKASTSGRIEETGKIGGDFKVQSNPEFLQKRKELFDSILASEKERIAGMIKRHGTACAEFHFHSCCVCSQAPRDYRHHDARWGSEGGHFLANHPNGHCGWNFQEPGKEGCCREGSCCASLRVTCGYRA